MTLDAWRGVCANGAVTDAASEAADLRKVLATERAKTQAYFEALRATANSPHANDRTKDETRRLLSLAVEAGIYDNTLEAK